MYGVLPPGGGSRIYDKAPFKQEQAFFRNGFVHPLACYHTAIDDLPKAERFQEGDPTLIIEMQRANFGEHRETADVRRLAYHISHQEEHDIYALAGP